MINFVAFFTNKLNISFLPNKFLLTFLILSTFPMLCFAQEEKLLNTKRVVWKSLGKYSILEKNNNLLEKKDYSQLSDKILLNKNNSLLIKVNDSKITRITTQDNKLNYIDVLRITGYQQKLTKAPAKEIILQSQSLLLQPPHYLADVSYEIKLKNDAPFDQLQIKVEENADENFPFYFHDLEQIAQQAIEKGEWQKLSANVWQKLEPGDELIDFYRNQFATLPWLSNQSSPEYEKLYRKAKLALALIKHQDKNLLFSAKEPLDIVSEKSEIFFSDELTYKYGSNFTLTVEGPMLIKINSRFVYPSNTIHEVAKYSLKVKLDNSFYEQIFLDTRIDDICELKTDYQQKPLGRLRQKSLFIPIGTHTLSLNTVEPLYISLTKFIKERKTLSESLKEKNFNQKIESYLRKIVELTENKEHNDRHAHFVHAAVLFDLNKGQEALSELKELVENKHKDLITYAASKLIISILCQANRFEEAYCYSPSFFFKKDLLLQSTTAKLNSNESLTHLLALALAFELGLEYTKNYRLLNQHLQAAQFVYEFYKFDIKDSQSYELSAESLKWTNELYATNPELIKSYDEFLSLNPINKKFRRLRTRAWFDFTYWKELNAERYNGKNRVVFFDYVNVNLPEDFDKEDVLTIQNICFTDPQSPYFKPIDYFKKDSKLFSIPTNTNLEIDFRNPFDASNKLVPVELKIENPCSQLLDLIIYIDQQKIKKEIIYSNKQTINLSLTSGLHSLMFETKPINNQPTCIKLYLDHPPLTDIYQRKTYLINWLAFDEKTYLPLGIGENEKIDFITKDDLNPTIGRLLINSLDKVANGVETIIDILIDGIPRETIFLDPKLNNLSSSVGKELYPYEIMFPIPSGKHRISVIQKTNINANLFINFSLRLRRNEEENPSK